MDSGHKIYYGPVYLRRESEPYITLLFLTAIFHVMIFALVYVHDPIAPKIGAFLLKLVWILQGVTGLFFLAAVIAGESLSLFIPSEKFKAYEKFNIVRRLEESPGISFFRISLTRSACILAFLVCVVPPLLLVSFYASVPELVPPIFSNFIKSGILPPP